MALVAAKAQQVFHGFCNLTGVTFTRLSGASVLYAAGRAASA